MQSLNGIKVIIVGAGYASLSSAIELARKGASVHVFESLPDLSNLGDVIMVTANATRIMRKWPGVLQKLVDAASQPENMTLLDKGGKILFAQKLEGDYDGYPSVYTNRGRAQHVMYDEALRLGVQFTFGKRILDYWEEADCAGIVVDGQKVQADLVVAGDGVHSKARLFVTGVQDKPKRSGFAVYRSWFDLDALKDDPLTKVFATSGRDEIYTWIGTDVHAVVTTNNKLRSITAFVTHRDNYTVGESWSFPGTRKDMLAVIEGWDPVLRAVFEKIPDSAIIDYKLLWRDPVKQWTSKGGRILLVGDAAHPHLATSGAGGGQAIEDGATIAALLEKTKKDNIPLATAVFEKLRFERTSLTQRLGWEQRHRWHQTDWEAVARNPEYLKFPQPAWLYGLDAEQYTLDNFDSAAASIQKGSEFRNKNVPEGHVHEDWTIDTMMELEKKQGREDMYVVK